MDFEELARERYSLRYMDPEKKVEMEKLQKLAEVARISPSACNLQRHRLTMVVSDEGIGKIKKCTQCHFNAPAVIILSIDSDTGKSIMDKTAGKKFGLIDIGIVAAHIALEATELGLGSTIVGLFDEKKIKKEFDIPKGQTPVLIMPIGYPTEKGGPSIKHKSRYPLDKTVSWM